MQGDSTEKDHDFLGRAVPGRALRSRPRGVLHRSVRCVTSAKTQVALLKQEAVLATVQQRSPQQLIIIISCHDRVKINNSIKNAFLYCLHKDLTQEQQLAKFVSPVAHKAHRCKSSPSPTNILRHLFSSYFLVFQ